MSSVTAVVELSQEVQINTESPLEEEKVVMLEERYRPTKE
jgi:hypothetical protein